MYNSILDTTFGIKWVVEEPEFISVQFQMPIAII